MTKREADLAVLSCSSRCRKPLGKRVSYYRYINQKKIGRADVDLQWQTMLEVDLPGDVGLQWLAFWGAQSAYDRPHSANGYPASSREDSDHRRLLAQAHTLSR